LNINLAFSSRLFAEIILRYSESIRSTRTKQVRFKKELDLMHTTSTQATNIFQIFYPWNETVNSHTILNIDALSLMMPYPVKNLLDPINRFIIRSKNTVLAYSHNGGFCIKWTGKKHNRKCFSIPFVSNVFNS